MNDELLATQPSQGLAESLVPRAPSNGHASIGEVWEPYTGRRTGLRKPAGQPEHPAASLVGHGVPIDNLGLRDACRSAVGKWV